MQEYFGVEQSRRVISLPHLEALCFQQVLPSQGLSRYPLDMETTPTVLLEQEYKKRKTKNPGYSLRAFAQALGIPSGRLSQYFSGKRKITPQVAEKISTSLNLSPQEKRQFMKAVVGLQTNLSASMLSFIENPQELEFDQFEMIAESLHFEILSLIETQDFKSDVAWISKRLNRNPIEIRAALERLVRLNLVSKENSKIQLVHGKGIASPSDIASKAIRKAHKKNLEHAIECLETTTVYERDYSTMTIAIDPERLETAKEMMRVFRRTLTAYLENGEKKEVYRLNMNLIPVTRKQKEKRS